MANVKKVSIWRQIANYISRVPSQEEGCLYFVGAQAVIDSGSVNGICYQVYSDGFCIQSGRANNNIMVNLPRAYNSTFFHVVATPFGGAQGCGVDINGVNQITVHTGTGNDACFITCGYLNL